VTATANSATDLRAQWLTTSEIAAAYGRSEQRVREWCRDGTLTAFGFRIHRTRGGWWIAYPETPRLPQPPA
jgi:hypothetical protein